MKISCVYSLLAVVVLLATCSPKPGQFNLPYPTPRPDTTALRFMPGIVCSDSLDFNLAFARDGQSIYFSRSRQGKWVILQTTFDGKTWSHPKPVPFSAQPYSQADPFVDLQGNLYYITNAPRHAADTLPDFDIWFVKPVGKDRWSAPTPVPVINSDSAEYYISIAKNGNLYFASNRPGGYGGLDIYVSRYIDHQYTMPENLGAGINTAMDEHDPLILGDDESALVFNAADRPEGYGQADLYYSLKQPDSSWGKSKNMGPLFNTATYEYCPNVSPDNQYFFFSSEYDVKWIGLNQLPFAQQR